LFSNCAGRDHVDFKGLRLRRTLLETPSGFAIFDIHEAVFQDPKVLI
jgi:hypothetical protein